jgi:hypothetical protein
MSCLASNLITWFAPRSNMSAPSSHGITRPLNSMIGVPALIGRVANNPMPLIADLRFCHSRFRCCSLISSPHSLIDCILLFCHPKTSIFGRFCHHGSLKTPAYSCVAITLPDSSYARMTALCDRLRNFAYSMASFGSLYHSRPSMCVCFNRKKDANRFAASHCEQSNENKREAG